MKLVSLTKQHFISKWIFEYIATGKNMKQWKMRSPSYCPFCQHKDEDTIHILSFMYQDAKAAQKKALWKLVESLIRIETYPNAVCAIRNEIE